MAKKTSREKKKKKETLKKRRETRAAKQAFAPQPSSPREKHPRTREKLKGRSME